MNRMSWGVDNTTIHDRAARIVRWSTSQEYITADVTPAVKVALLASASQKRCCNDCGVYQPPWWLTSPTCSLKPMEWNLRVMPPRIASSVHIHFLLLLNNISATFWDSLTRMILRNDLLILMLIDLRNLLITLSSEEHIQVERLGDLKNTCDI